MSSTVSGSAYSSTSRVTGMFSSMDTDAMVKKMNAGQQSKIDKQQQLKTTYGWRNEATTDISGVVKTFANDYTSVLGTSSMLQSSTYFSYNITTPSTKNAVTLSASAGAEIGETTIQVNQLAKNATTTSSGKVSANGTEIAANNTTTLGQLSLKTPLTFGADGNLSFSINGKRFQFSKDTTLQNMLNTINSDKTADVTMKYSRLSDSFTITANSGGKDSKVTIENFGGNAFGADSAFGIGIGTTANGQNSIAVINGNTVERDKNAYTIDGTEYKLHKVTKGTDEETVSFTVARDYSATTKAIKGFLDALNGMLTKVDTLTSEKSYSKDYPPLTDEQRKSMSEDQIKAWEKKAKSGLLRRDPDLVKLSADLKAAFYTAVGGTGKTASAIGITTGSYFDKTNKGKLVLDTNALTQALESNPEQVIAMFTGGSSSSASGDQGLIYKIKDALNTYTKAASNTVTENTKKISDIDKKAKLMQNKLDTMADRYYKKFSRMETALSKMNAQSSYISQLFKS